MAEIHLNSITTTNNGNKYKVNDIPELLDIRLGADGTEYESAGDAVRGQIGQIEGTLITDTAIGSIASFTDGSDGIPVRDLSVNVEPKQDLHGYSNPWPAGGGKNLVKPFNPITTSGVTVETTASGEIWVHGTPTITSGYIEFPTGGYFPASIIDKTITLSVNEKTTGVGFAVGSSNGGLNLTMSETNTSHTGVYTLNAGSVPGQLNINVRYDVGAIDKKYKVQLEVGSSATSWVPYSNICPITGWTEAKVTRTGKNLLDMYGVSENGKNYLSKNIFAKAGTYTVSATGISGNYATYVREAGTEGSSAGAVVAERVSQGNLTFTLTKDTALMVQWYTPNDTSGTLTGKTFQLEVGSTATTYEPYQGTTITIPLGSTVYGGTLDVSTGVLTVDRAMVDIGTLTWETIHTGSTRKAIRTSLPSAYPGYPNQTLDIVQTTYKFAGYVSSASGLSSPDSKDLGFYMYRNSTNTTPQTIYMVVDSNATPSGTLVYEVATPTTVQLTPQQLTTLLGQNNIFADAGDVDVTYVADTKLYIAKMIANALNS